MDQIVETQLTALGKTRQEFNAELGPNCDQVPPADSFFWDVVHAMADYRIKTNGYPTPPLPRSHLGGTRAATATSAAPTWA